MLRDRFSPGSLCDVRPRAVFRLLAAVCLCAANALAATVLEVKVAGPDGQPLPGAAVVISETGQEVVTGADGTGRFDNVAPGRYHVTARLDGFAPLRAEVVVADGATPRVDLSLSRQLHFSEAVTVSPAARDTFESYQPTEVLAGEELQQRLGPTLGETLGREAGVNIRAFGPGPARPVIRGLDGDRVLILENGARTGDLSSQSADHGVTLDPASAARIEVVRGPATLLYGSNALGGVVNVISDEIPTGPVRGTHGAATVQGATANSLAGGAANLAGGNGRWAFRVTGSAQRAGDVDTPEGKIPNSQSEMKSGGGSLGWTGDNGYAGAAYEYTDSNYGIPFVEEGGTTLTPRRHRLDFRAERRNLGSVLEGVKLQLGYRNYRHDEHAASGDIATSFHNKFGEAQLMLNHRPAGRLKGTIGVWGTHRDYTSEGEEALAPPTRQNAFSAFLYEELPFPHVTLQLGGRVDRTTYDTDPEAVPERTGLRDRDFTEFSVSAGVLGYLREDLTLAVNVARAARNPSLEELYNFGPHVGNFAFEVGNPDLQAEHGLGVDVSLRWRRPRFAGELTAFRNAIDNFIFAFPTGEVEDDLPVVNYLSADSLLLGFEAHVDLGLTRSLWLELGGDAVRGELRNTKDPLPRMPPLRAWASLRYERGGLHVEGEVRTADRQDRVFGVETPTAGYALFNGHASYVLTTGRTAHTFTVRLDNAADRLYRSHLNFIKDQAPEVGRSLKAVYSVRF